MSSATEDYAAILAEVDFTALKRDAAVDRADAVRSVGRAIVDWLRAGIKLRHSDDALTHPAAGSLCGC